MNEPGSIGLEDVVSMHASSRTLYHSLGQIIRSKIQSGEWVVNQQIPSERELIKIFNVSRATVRQGIENLVKEGVLYRLQGKGTFVSPPKLERGVLRLMEFSDVVKQIGLKPDVQLVGKEKLTPPSNIQKILSLSDGDDVIWLQRLLLLNGTPVLIETSYFSASRYPELLNDYDGTEDVHAIQLKYFGTRVTHARETFEPVILEDKEAELLGTQGGFPALWVEYIVYDATEHAVAYITSLMRGDRCRFYTDLVFENG